MTDLATSTILPPPPAKCFLVGIGGIGMSALAQFLAWRGYRVAGSDRGLEERAKQPLYDQLGSQDIKVYPQDGSGIAAESPAFLIVSTAIEADNPDLKAACGLPVLHRAVALSRLIAQTGLPLVGIAGSCGKTSVTGWTASALKAAGHGVLMVNGGYVLDFESATFPGNFHADEKPEFVVAEIDESDHSIREFSPDYAAVLNIGDDHYEREELQRVFCDFLKRTRRAAVLPEGLDVLREAAAHLRMRFIPEAPAGYASKPNGIVFTSSDGLSVATTQSGRHSAWNGSAVYALLREILPSAAPSAIAQALGAFKGVRQRFEVVAPPREGRPAIVNDYAHNPEKVAAAIACAHERFGGPLGIVFQPHGFSALAFTREPLLEHLRQCLKGDDLFIMLPVYYAGGTVAFTPTADEVAAQYAAAGLPVRHMGDRPAAVAILKARKDLKAWLILGGRDASLREWSLQLARG